MKRFDSAGRSSTWRAKPIGVALAAGMAACLISCGPQAQSPPPRSTPADATNAAADPRPTGAKPAPDIAKLLGKWDRADGDYTIEIRAAGADGKLDAGYFNPNPIHVSRALAVSEQGKVKVFVELQDANYPGCTYTLVHDPAADQLYGTYFQAAIQETYDVTFARRRQGQ